jgi:hypothetical protein
MGLLEKKGVGEDSDKMDDTVQKSRTLVSAVQHVLFRIVWSS